MVVPKNLLHVMKEFKLTMKIRLIYGVTYRSQSAPALAIPTF
jgi:hypothetical protein